MSKTRSGDDEPVPPIVLSVAGERNYLGPSATVVFQGTSVTNTSGKNQTVYVQLDLDECITVSDMERMAWEKRFGESDKPSVLTERSYYDASSTGMAVKNKVEGDAQVEFDLHDERDGEAPTRQLFLHIELPNCYISKARSTATADSYDKLKRTASANGVVFSDNQFAALLGKNNSGPLSKSLGRCRMEPPPQDGKFVMKIEEAIARYSVDFALLKDDLAKQSAAKQPPTPAPRARPATPTAGRGTPATELADDDDEEGDGDGDGGAAPPKASFSGEAARAFLATFLPGFQATQDNRHERVELVKQIISAGEDQPFNTDGWTITTVCRAMKKQGVKANKARRAPAAPPS